MSFQTFFFCVCLNARTAAFQEQVGTVQSRFFCARPYKPASWLALPVPPGSKSEPASLASLLTLKFKKKENVYQSLYV